MSKPIRIQKYLSEKGLCSRRKAEQYIQKGWVTVNGETVRVLGTTIDPDKDTVALSDKVQKEKDNQQYIALYKPRGIVTNLPQGREKEIRDIIPSEYQALSAIGRLDKESEGLILLTDDGVFTKKLLQGDPPHERTYHVTIDMPLNMGIISQFEKGMALFGGMTKPIKVDRVGDLKYSLTMIEGKNRQIRRMMQKVGRTVLELKRFQYGPYNLSDLKLKLGQFRSFNPWFFLDIFI